MVIVVSFPRQLLHELVFKFIAMWKSIHLCPEHSTWYAVLSGSKQGRKQVGKEVRKDNDSCQGFVDMSETQCVVGATC